MSTAEDDAVIDAMAADAGAGGEEDVDLDQIEAEAAAAGIEADGDGGVVDDEIEEMKRRVQEMEEEAAKLNEMQSQVEKQMGGAVTAGQIATMDDNSIYIGQVDYAATPEELQALFQSCGTINRVTILCDKFSGQPKGYAYIEFASKDAVESALLLHDTTFRGRQIKVMPKRQNVLGYNRGRGRGRGRGAGSFRSRGRGYRGGYRGRGRGGYHPYY